MNNYEKQRIHFSHITYPPPANTYTQRGKKPFLLLSDLAHLHEQYTDLSVTKRFYIKIIGLRSLGLSHCCELEQHSDWWGKAIIHCLTSTAKAWPYRIQFGKVCWNQTKTYTQKMVSDYPVDNECAMLYISVYGIIPIRRFSHEVNMPRVGSTFRLAYIYTPVEVSRNESST